MQKSVPAMRERLVACAPLVLWTAVILVLGSSQGSSAQTSRFIKPILEFFLPNAAPDTFLIVHGLIRKTAHFVEYGILAMLAARAYLISASSKLKWWATFSIAAVAAVACVDELMQSFLTARTGSAWDVLLDLSGGLVGLALYYLLNYRKGSSESG